MIEKKSREELKELIENNNITALVEYLNEYRDEITDIKYILDSFMRIEKDYIKTSSQSHVNTDYQKFYNEYIRALDIGLRRGAVPNTSEYRNKVEEIISISAGLDTYVKSIAFPLYTARYYTQMYNNNITPYTDKRMEIIKNYDMAINRGSKMAISEKAKFISKLQILTHDLNYYNADYDLEQFIAKVSNRVDNDNLSILLYGPENAGMKEFAEKLFSTMNKKYECISSHHLNARSNLLKVLNDNQYHDLILYNIDTCFNLYNRHEDDKDFVTQSNTESLINVISKKTQSVILIVNDISKLSENLLDAFVIKIRFDYMNRQQKQLALQKVFGLQVSNQLDDVNGLVYADFLRVKDKTTLLNIVDEIDIIKLLKEEADNKPKFLTYSAPVSFFDINLVNSNVDLMELTAKLEKSPLPFTMLISGPAGTGKSYYLRYLAHRIGKNVIEKTSAELFSRYQGEPAKNILNLFKEAEEKNAVIIFDEIENVAINRQEFSGEGGFKADMVNAFLTCLENTKCPFMATTNFISNVDKAILRRFIFKLRFDYLKPKQIAYAFSYTFNLMPPAEILKLGGLTSGDFAVVKKKAQILNICDKMELYEMLKEEINIKSIGKTVYFDDNVNFDRNFINIEDNSLDLYVKQIKENKNSHFSILLYGPSGTGKSLYLRHLAKELGYEIIERRASDILSKWHGETEQNIAQAFEEAKNRRAMIIFDEIDSFLPDKHSVMNNIDVRLVNEFLVQLENHPYPVGGTTNYIENIEKACIRRFKIQAKFDYLRKDQYAYVYHKTFGFQPPKDIEKLIKLTPAIFSLAAEKVSLENVQSDEKRVFEIFLDEVKKSTGRNILEETDKTYENILIDNTPLYTTPVSDNYDKILTGFVKVLTDTGHGSGFFITDDGFILTNKHVVKEEKLVKIELFSGRQVSGEVIRTNSLDIALIKISAENKVYPMPIRTREINIGSTVFSFGNPGNKNQVLSKGCITRYTNVNNAQRIETDCFMDNGSSGGPLLDEYGNVIGVNVEGWLKGKANLGINLHLSINDALRVLSIKVKEADNIK